MKNYDQADHTMNGFGTTRLAKTCFAQSLPQAPHSGQLCEPLHSCCTLLSTDSVLQCFSSKASCPSRNAQLVFSAWPLALQSHSALHCNARRQKKALLPSCSQLWLATGSVFGNIVSFQSGRDTQIECCDREGVVTEFQSRRPLSAFKAKKTHLARFRSCFVFHSKLLYYIVVYTCSVI